MELKYVLSLGHLNPEVSSNRTFMELKFTNRSNLA